MSWLGGFGVFLGLGFLAAVQASQTCSARARFEFMGGRRTFCALSVNWDLLEEVPSIERGQPAAAEAGICTVIADESANGRRAVKRVPACLVEVTDNRPPWARTISEQICRPKPSPCPAAARLFLPNRTNSLPITPPANRSPPPHTPQQR